MLDQEVQEERKRHSLMELAGLDTDEDRPKRVSRPKIGAGPDRTALGREGEFDDAVPEHFKAAPKPKPKKKDEDDDFLKLIEDEVKKPD